MTLANARAQFVERVRLHQIAAGQQPRDYALTECLRGPYIELLIGVADGIDPDHRQLRVGAAILGYNTLVYALGSAADTATGRG